MSTCEQIRPASAKARLIIHADCTTCGRLHDDDAEPLMVPSLALEHTARTAHVVVLNGTSDLPDEPGTTEEGLPSTGTDTFYVDIPTVHCIGNADGSWQNVATYPSRSEAIQFAQSHFGADEQGYVCLVSG